LFKHWPKAENDFDLNLTTEDTESKEEEVLVCCYENHRFDSRGECLIRFVKPLAIKLADAFTKRLTAWPSKLNPLIFLTPIEDISRRAREKRGKQRSG
jgi:hypothetical protein